jgi:CRP/FNR family cyclic AMP-dependent transcriptional regulator
MVSPMSREVKDQRRNIMSPNTTPLQMKPRFEDVLAYLPISSTKEYAKGQVIYSPEDPSQSIYLVVMGKVEISQIAGKGKEVLLEIVRPAELFGESAFLYVPCRKEQATALEKTHVMTWAISDVEDLVMKRPRLAVALLQVLAQRNVEFTRRIESFST